MKQDLVPRWHDPRGQRHDSGIRSSSKPILQTLQVCRAAAAIVVVLFHAGFQLSGQHFFAGHANHLEQIFWFGGQAGVIFFFVLSGFIITHIHFDDLDTPSRALPFLRKRVSRIYPIYILVFFAVYAVGLLTPAAAAKMPTDPVVLLKALLLLPQEKTPLIATGAPVLIVAWSLQYEMLFYFAFAAGIVDRRILAVLCMLFATNLVFQPTGAGGFPTEFFANHVISVFCIGAGAAAIFRYASPLRGAQQLARGASLALVLIAAIATLTRGNGNEQFIEITYAATSAILVLALATMEAERPAYFARLQGAWVLIGKASFAIYLIHVPVIWVLGRTAAQVLPLSALTATLAFGLIVPTCILAGIALHLGVEAPILRWFSRRTTALPGSHPA